MDPENISLETRPVTLSTWPDFEAFMTGAECNGCWCTWFRLKEDTFMGMSEDERREYMHTLVVSGKTPGLLAYAGGRPIAWVSISPRNDYPFLLDNVPGMKFDDPSVWSLMCFYADVNYRGKGIMAKLIAAAADFARASGARVVEAYPVDPSVHPIKEQWQAYYGVVSTFARAGFTKVGEAREGQPVMRLAF